MTVVGRGSDHPLFCYRGTVETRDLAEILEPAVRNSECVSRSSLEDGDGDDDAVAGK